LSVGDLVIPMPGSCWSDTMTLSATQVIKLRPDVDLEQAAMLKANPATASVLLRDICALQPGDWVVQNAANSAVGQNVIRIAAKRGINVLSIVRRSGAETQARAAGATHVLIDDGTGYAAVPADIPLARLAFDAIGGTATERLGALVEKGGTVVTYGLLSGDAPRLTSHDLVFRGVILRGFWLAAWFGETQPETISATYQELTGWLSEGAIGAPVAATYDLDRFADAIRHAAQEGRDGKILLTGAAWA
jgi:trans-2-enoyl-CoA reductase